VAAVSDAGQVAARVCELTVVISTHEPLESLRPLLRSLAVQSEAAPEDYETIVVYEGEVNARELLKPLRLPYRVTLVQRAKGDIGSPRNRAARQAKGRYCLFLDDKLVADPELLIEHLRVQRADAPVVSIGKCSNGSHRPANRWHWRVESETDESPRGGRAVSPLFLNCGGNYCLPRALLFQVGAFDDEIDLRTDTFAADLELGFRLHQAAARFLLLPTARAEDHAHPSLRQAMKRHEERGTDEVRLYQRYSDLLPHLAIGGGNEPGSGVNDVSHWRLAAIRNLLLTLRLPPSILAALAALLPRKKRQQAERLLFSYCYWRGVRRASPSRDSWRRLRRGATILMYHAIGRPGESPARFVVPEARFRRQMAWLHRRGYNVIGVDELVRCHRENTLPPARSVALTFDDGYTDNLDLELPVLKRHGFTATFFLSSKNREPNGQADEPAAVTRADGLGGRPRVLLQEATQFLECGTVGAHTRTHPDLTSVTIPEADQEIRGSKADLETALGTQVSLFAYPYGCHDDRVRQLVADAGFVAACSTEPGRNRPATDPYQLRRFSIDGTDSLLRFALTLWLGEILTHARRRRRNRAADAGEQPDAQSADLHRK
jgi:peptidoglycan/xylan/chitin deacetylase (PgdA/CDA1 family)